MHLKILYYEKKNIIEFGRYIQEKFSKQISQKSFICKTIYPGP